MTLLLVAKNDSVASTLARYFEGHPHVQIVCERRLRRERRRESMQQFLEHERRAGTKRNLYGKLVHPRERRGTSIWRLADAALIE